MTTNVLVQSKWVVMTLAICSLCACKLIPDLSFSEPPANAPGMSDSRLLQGITLSPIQVEQSQLVNASPLSLVEDYQRLLTRIKDPELRAQVSIRLADLKMLVAEQAQEMGTALEPGRGYYDLAIADYQSALKGLEGKRAAHSGLAADEDPDKESVKAELLYQLSRAYDLQGQGQESQRVLARLIGEHPDSEHVGEALFRQGEQAFNRAEYSAAIQAYGAVVEDYPHSDFYPTAAYMLGWSYFKREAFVPALTAFGLMLDASFAGVNAGQMAELNALGLGQQKLVKDALRMVALLFEYQGTEADIPGFFAAAQPVPGGHSEEYAHLVYGELAQQHLDNDRYKDSADVYLTFAEQYPRHPMAIDFFVRHIDAFILGGFPNQVMPAKARFVAAYGISGEHWQVHAHALDYLNAYLKELAQYEHSLAQLLGAQESEQRLEDWQAQQALAYARAARWYREFLNAFPEDPGTAEMMFNLAESLYESDNLMGAVEAYQAYAGLEPQPDKAADAAYSAILALGTLISNASDDERHGLMSRYRDSQVDFTRTFANDVRAVRIAQVMMEEAFDNRAHQHTREWGQWLLARADLLEQTVLDKVRLALAHTHFATADYEAAEIAYGAIVKAMPADAPQRRALNRNRAIGQYQLAKQKVSAIETQTDGDVAATKHWQAVIDHLDRVRSLSPDPDTVRNAHYDIATYWLRAQNWQGATKELLSFEHIYGTDPLTQGVPEKLIRAYEEQQLWGLAAARLKSIWQQQPDSEMGREALYQAATYLEADGQRQEALKSFRTYAHRYPEPFALVTEARFTMSQFYADSGEDSKRRFWLKKLMDGHAQAGVAATERSQTLAAMSALVFADDAGTAFKQRKLSLPLNKSLKAKRQALEKAVAAYDVVLSYGIRQYSTDATFKLASIYQTLALDLMASSRPKGLNTLEIEQYNLLLEEQAYPFEERAIALHAANAKRAWQGVYDTFVQRSFVELARLNPGRYGKQEQQEALTNDLL